MSRHHQALMVWIAVLPTLTLLQLALGGLLEAVPPYLRPPIVATLVVPIVVYGLLPRLQRLGARLVKERKATRRGS
jgi:antibiotic biosynthesis monooxygenase (ABM) superfamily enzyme